MLYKGGKFSVRENPLKWKLLPVVLFIMLYKVVLTFESMDEILACVHWNESYWAVLSCGEVYFAAQGSSADEILTSDHSKESFWAILSCGEVYYAAQGSSA